MLKGDPPTAIIFDDFGNKVKEFWEIVAVAVAVVVVAAVALIVVTGESAIGAISAASGALATTVAVTVATLEVVGLALEVKALYDYTQDRDEYVLAKNVAPGLLFLGAGKLVERVGGEIIKHFSKGVD